MKPVHLGALIAVLGMAWAAGLASAEGIQELEKQVQAGNASVSVKEDLAEAYLRECELEKSLNLWREILRQQPDHERARTVVDRLTAQALDLDSQLDILSTMIEKDIIDRVTEDLLAAASQRAATDAQKARILYLRGALSLAAAGEGRSRPSFEAVLKLYPDTPWAARSAFALAEFESGAGRTDEAERLLRSVAQNENMPDQAVREEARLRLLLLESPGLTGEQRIAALRELLPQVTTPEVRRQVLGELVTTITTTQGAWVPEAVDAAGGILATDPPAEQAGDILLEMLEVAKTNRDAGTLDRLLAVLKEARFDDPVLAKEADLVRVEALLSRAVVEDDAERMRRFAATAHEVLNELRASGIGGQRKRVDDLQGRAYLVEAQKLVALSGTTEALPVIMKAKEHYLALLPGAPPECLERICSIGKLLEHAGEWETAASLYQEIATSFPYTPQGRDALLKVAELYASALNVPTEALEVYAQYAARYPAELPYRQRDIGERLRRLGYSSVLDFQKRNLLKPDGIVGPITRKKLEEVEAAFDLISIPDQDDPRPPARIPDLVDMISEKQRRATPPSVLIVEAGPDRAPTAAWAERGILLGQFVHPDMFQIAQRLDKEGHHHDAIVAYRLFLNLFPTKKQADDALIAIARLFRENLLFDEALGAYRELMEDFPKGNVTSDAYIEAAGCLENLGRWKEAAELYDLYVKKFPKYDRVSLCKERLALLAEIQQYEDFIADDPQNTKVAEAQYQIGKILYEKFKNYTKAAVEFGKVGERFPAHVRAPEALFTAGTAQLRAENFPAARATFAETVARYPDSRLADDAQYWIGHTYEYGARALGKLDELRIVLKRRSLQDRVALIADLPLRRHYSPEAQPGPEMPEEVWGGDALGVLASGSRRDRVNADLRQAIQEYRKVVDNFKFGDMAGNALLRIGTIHTQYLKDPERGIAAYQELLDHYPASKEAMEALYEVGDYRLANKQYEEAIRAYQQFIYNYPREAKVEDAMLAIARCHVESKAWDKALDAYESYLSKFPDGKQAGFAKAQITWIRTYHF